MKKLGNLIRSFDEMMFQGLDTVKQHHLYQQANALLTPLTEDKQRMVGGFAGLSVIALPFIPVFFVLIYNMSERSELMAKEESLSKIYQLSQKQRQIAGLGKSLITPTPIENKTKLQAKITALANNKGITPSKINVVEFGQDSATGLAKTRGTLSFQQFSSADFFGLLNGLLISQKFKIERIKIEKNPKKNFLIGTVDIIHYSKVKK
jgi:hypothetical protein